MLINGVYSWISVKEWHVVGWNRGRLAFFDGCFENWTEAFDKSNDVHMGVQRVYEDSKGNVWVFNFGVQYYFPAGSKKYRLVTIGFF